MTLKKHGMELHCNECKLRICDDSGNFDISVPLHDAESNLRGTAELSCHVSAENHRVELKQWVDNQEHPIEPATGDWQRVTKALEFVAEQRICGNRKVCPVDVVELVAKRTTR